jgi:hypothetical protein
VVSAHEPSVGVKVYKVVAVLFRLGAQLPVILLLEVVGRADKVVPKHTAATCVKVGITTVFTVTVITLLEAAPDQSDLQSTRANLL